MPEIPNKEMQTPYSTETYKPLRTLLYLGGFVAILLIAFFFLEGCEKDKSLGQMSAQIDTVSAQVDTSAARQLKQLKSDRFHDSLTSVAVMWQLQEVSATLEKQRDSTAWLQKINQQHLQDRERLDKIFLSAVNDQKQSFSSMMDEKLDSMVTRIDTLTNIQTKMTKLLGDSALTQRMSKASFDQIYKTASLKNQYFDSEVMFGKDSAGRDQASVVPLFKNKFDATMYEYVPPKKGKPGHVKVNVTETNIYAAIGADNFEFVIPALKGKPKKHKAVRRPKNNTRKRQRKNFNKTGG